MATIPSARSFYSCFNPRLSNLIKACHLTRKLFPARSAPPLSLIIRPFQGIRGHRGPFLSSMSKVGLNIMLGCNSHLIQTLLKPLGIIPSIIDLNWLMPLHCRVKHRQARSNLVPSKFHLLMKTCSRVNSPRELPPCIP